MKSVLAVFFVLFTFGSLCIFAQGIVKKSATELSPDDFTALNARIDRFMELQRMQSWGEIYDDLLAITESKEEYVEGQKRQQSRFEVFDDRKIYVYNAPRNDWVFVSACVTVVAGNERKRFAGWLDAFKVDGVWRFSKIELRRQVGNAPEKCDN